MVNPAINSKPRDFTSIQDAGLRGFTQKTIPSNYQSNASRFTSGLVPKSNHLRPIIKNYPFL